ncbi:hypothetical protein PENSPDRAFT_383189 [Peniophora sp. CONT]|nr:hypothetical protein PENSPDRAFT_383189 [Peniophora sp. CONT]
MATTYSTAHSMPSPQFAGRRPLPTPGKAPSRTPEPLQHPQPLPPPLPVSPPPPPPPLPAALSSSLGSRNNASAGSVVTPGTHSTRRPLPNPGTPTPVDTSGQAGFVPYWKRNLPPLSTAVEGVQQPVPQQAATQRPLPASPTVGAPGAIVEKISAISVPRGWKDEGGYIEPPRLPPHLPSARSPSPSKYGVRQLPGRSQSIVDEHRNAAVTRTQTLPQINPHNQPQAHKPSHSLTLATGQLPRTTPASTPTSPTAWPATLPALPRAPVAKPAFVPHNHILRRLSPSPSPTHSRSPSRERDLPPPPPKFPLSRTPSPVSPIRFAERSDSRGSSPVSPISFAAHSPERVPYRTNPYSIVMPGTRSQPPSPVRRDREMPLPPLHTVERGRTLGNAANRHRNDVFPKSQPPQNSYSQMQQYNQQFNQAPSSAASRGNPAQSPPTPGSASVSPRVQQQQQQTSPRVQQASPAFVQAQQAFAQGQNQGQQSPFQPHAQPGAFQPNRRAPSPTRPQPVPPSPHIPQTNANVVNVLNSLNSTKPMAIANGTSNPSGARAIPSAFARRREADYEAPAIKTGTKNVIGARTRSPSGTGRELPSAPGVRRGSEAGKGGVTVNGGVPNVMVNGGDVPSISLDGGGGMPSISLPDDEDDANGPQINVSGPTINVSSDTHSSSPSLPRVGAPSSLPHVHASNVGPLPTKGGDRLIKKGGGRLACGGCGQPIAGRVVSAMGARWHPGCFRCCVCDELLEFVSSFEGDGRAYCHLDYHEKYAPRCYHCKTAIVDERFITLDDPELGERTYHEQHFFCAECGDPFLTKHATLSGGSENLTFSGDGAFGDDGEGVLFTVYRGHPYCEACHVRLRAPRCKRCARPVRDGQDALEALGGKWHWECFVCAGCERPFEDPSFFQRENKPYCEPCFSVIIKSEL